MIALNFFTWIGDLFKNVLFVPFNNLRLELATQEGGWWTSNAINWVFLFVLIILLAYWMKKSRKFLEEDTEDRA